MTNAEMGSGASLRELAVRALEAGINPLPPMNNMTKGPRSIVVGVDDKGKPIRQWKPFQERFVTDEELDNWYLHEHATGLGFVTGKISRLELLEFDCAETYLKYKELVIKVGLDLIVEVLEAGYLERTPGGGVHWLYRIDSVNPPAKLARRYKHVDEYNEKEKEESDAAVVTGKTKRHIKVLIETKGEGGYVVVAPSYGSVHPSGKPYELISGSIETIVTLTPKERDALWNLARTFNDMPDEEKPPPKPKLHERKDSSGKLKAGTDFNERGTWAEALPGWTEICTQADTTYWRRPGKTRGQSATTGHYGHDILRVFTSSTALDTIQPGTNKGKYTKFAALTKLEYNGDFRACAKALKLKGYGDPSISDGTHVKTSHEKVKVPLTSTMDERTGKLPVNVSIDDYLSNSSPEGPPSHAGDAGANGHPTGTDAPDGRTSDPGVPYEPIDGAVAPPHTPPRRPYTDTGNAERLVDAYVSDIHYVHKWNKWLIWDGRCWLQDEDGTIHRIAINVVRSIYGEADDDATFNWAKRSENEARINAMISLSRHMNPVPISVDNLNQHPFLFNCPNATIDLESGSACGEPHPNSRDDMLTQVCPTEYDPAARCPKWLEFLGVIFNGDADLIEYFKKICGMSITGYVEQQIMPILYGDGANGKTVVTNTLMGVLGEYTQKAPSKLLMYKKFDAHPTELTTLYGKRLIIASETEKGDRFSEALVKELTGSEHISARRMREDFWTFKPTHKIWLVTNYRPNVDMGEAIWRRIRLIPFNVFIPEGKRDLDLSKTLIDEEASGILNWCIEGCRDWLWNDKKIDTPASVIDATAEYKEDSDNYREFLDEWCIDTKQVNDIRKKARDEGLMKEIEEEELYIRSSDFHNHYRFYCHLRGIRSVFGIKTFSMDMKKRFKWKRKEDGVYFYGIDINMKTQDDISTHEKSKLRDYDLRYYHHHSVLASMRSTHTRSDWMKISQDVSEYRPINDALYGN